MLKKSKTAVLTALAVMLSALSPLATYAENAEPVETIPERTLTQKLNDIPEIHDNEPIQTTAISTIPDRIYTCTSVPAIEIMPKEFPLEKNYDITVNVVDSMTGEHVDGVKVHLVETESLHSNVIERDFGTWDSSQSESYSFNTDFTFHSLADIFAVTAVIEDIPDDYSLRGGTTVVEDFIVAEAIDLFPNRNLNINTDFTIRLDKEYNENDEENYFTTTAVLKECASCGKMINIEDGINAPLAFVCKDCRASGAGGTRPQFPTESTTTSNILYGDANCDGEVSLADAVIIMQSLSNPDIYSLSEQGKSNADVYNTGDGITSQDALTIQQVNINLIPITDLPVYPTVIPD